MKLILSQEEINAAFGCRLQELGLANLNKSSIVVTFKSTRGVDGSTEAEVDFEFNEPTVTAMSTTENSPVATASAKEPANDTPDAAPNTDPDSNEVPESSNSDSLTDIFSKG